MNFPIQFVLFLFFTSIGTSAPSKEKDNISLKSDVIENNPDNLEVQLKSFIPNGKERSKAPLHEALDRRSLVTYSIGFRSYGDRLVAKASNFQRYDELTDVQINIQYPNSDPNIAAVVTFVDIQVDQGSNEGNAYIIEGGIGDRNIKITLEISNITYYSFSASIYGF